MDVSLLLQLVIHSLLIGYILYNHLGILSFGPSHHIRDQQHGKLNLRWVRAMMNRALIFLQIFALSGTTPHVPNGGRMVSDPYVVTLLYWTL